MFKYIQNEIASDYKDYIKLRKFLVKILFSNTCGALSSFRKKQLSKEQMFDKSAVVVANWNQFKKKKK